MHKLEAPDTRLALDAGPALTTTLPYHINLTLTRGSDGIAGPVIFRWSPTKSGFTFNGSVLLHHMKSELKSLDIDQSHLVDPNTEVNTKVNIYEQFLWELDPNVSETFLATLPERYQKLLKPGHRYTLLWPGSTIEAWNLGTKENHVD